jgi:hypothetical protein
MHTDVLIAPERGLRRRLAGAQRTLGFADGVAKGGNRQGFLPSV